MLSWRTQSHTLHEFTFVQSAQNLAQGLRDFWHSDASALKNYRGLRQAAFELEFLARLLRKAETEDQEIYEELLSLTKLLEDQLGQFDEVMEWQRWATTNGVKVSRRAIPENLQSLKSWMTAEGWLMARSEHSALHHVIWLFHQLTWLSDKKFRKEVAQRVARTCEKVQKKIDDGEFDPKNPLAYQFAEIEEKVHEARREIRKISMYISYSRGVFVFSHNKSDAPFSALLRSPLVHQPYAKLPPVRVDDPVKVPKSWFLAITRYVSDLGAAKDWAFHMEMARKLGHHQEPPPLLDFMGRPAELTMLVTQILTEVRKTRLLAELGDYISAQV